MKLTKAEYRLLDALHYRGWSAQTPRDFICSRRDLERRMIAKGLLSKRAQANGKIAATAAGRRSHSYGPR